MGLVTSLQCGCQSKPVSIAETVNAAGQRFAHLAQYKEMNCQVHLSMTEATKTNWLTKLSSEGGLTNSGSDSQLFAKLSQIGFQWRSTPYRCTLNHDRADDGTEAFAKVLEDTEKKMDSIFCVWIQSFYADSPLRGWQKGEGVPELIANGIRLKKGSDRWLEVKNDGEWVEAQMGPSTSLRAHYIKRDGKLYPDEVSFESEGQKSKVDDWAYEFKFGREVPSSLWFYAASTQDSSQAYMHLEISDCTWN